MQNVIILTQAEYAELTDYKQKCVYLKEDLEELDIAFYDVSTRLARYEELDSGIPLAQDFGQYVNPKLEAAFTQVPIAMLAEFKSIYGSYYRLKYRGSRKNDIGRTKAQKQATCLRSSASSFSAYVKW